MAESTSTARPGVRPIRRDARLAVAEGPRAMAEIAALLPAAPYLALAPRGDRHPVLVLPGLGGADGSTAVIRSYLGGRGFEAFGWGLGRNQGPGMPDLLPRLAARLEAVRQQGGGRRVSLVGWSMGGVFARLLAHHFPDRVRQVVTLGSPIGRPGTPASRAGRGDMGRLRALVSDPLPGVPGTAVYSRTDGIVPWQIARQAPSEIADNVEVYGSHIGLGFNASALYLLAERLAQPEDGWRPFERSGWKRWVFGPANHG
ncbi:MAG: alpha/beta hydrolase [Gammaproteobacteria bacterium]|nr:alpha/beta hydrolase [Gammaproteobacteria bacterium]